MTNFIGEHFYTLDSKNRLAIPVKFRASLHPDRSMILAQGLENCLNLYPLDEWNRLTEKLDLLKVPQQDDLRALKRMLFSSAHDAVFDEDGRILLPQNLVDYAFLKKDAAIVGVGKKIEIWSEKNWQLYKARQKLAFRRHAHSLEF